MHAGACAGPEMAFMGRVLGMMHSWWLTGTSRPAFVRQAMTLGLRACYHRSVMTPLLYKTRRRRICRPWPGASWWGFCAAVFLCAPFSVNHTHAYVPNAQAMC